MLRVACPKCGRNYEAGNDFAGMKVTCKNCQTEFCFPEDAELNRQIELAKQDANEKGIEFNADFTVLKRYPAELDFSSYDIPGCVTSIWKNSFKDCSKLENIKIPDSVTSIGKNAFRGCSKLENIRIPDSVTNIGSCVFWGCEMLTSMIIPNGVTSIGVGAFPLSLPLFLAEGNKSFLLENGVLFNRNKTILLRCPDKTNYIIPDGVTSIGRGAFSNCSKLTSMTIPNGVTSIGSGVFWDCENLKNVTIPDSVTSIGENVFRGCPCENWVKRNYGHLYK